MKKRYQEDKNDTEESLQKGSYVRDKRTKRKYNTSMATMPLSTLHTIEIETLQRRAEQENEPGNKNKFIKNILWILIAQVLIKVLGLIYRIVILRIPGFTDEANGYYSAGYELYALLLTFSSVGLPSVISKLISERMGKGDRVGTQRLFKVAFSMFTFVGGVISVLLFVFADKIAVRIYNIEEVKYVLKVLAPAIVFVSASSILRGYFSGIEDMKPTSVSQTLEQVLNSTLTILFTYLAIGKEPYLMAAAANASTFVSVLISFIYIGLYYKKYRVKVKRGDRSKSEISDKTNLDIIKMILRVSIPMTLGSMISVLNSFVDSLTVVNGIQKAFEGEMSRDALTEFAMTQNGILSKVYTVLSLPQAINIAFVTALLPSVSGLMAKGQKYKAEERIRESIAMSLLILFPAYIGLFVLAGPILRLIYPIASDGAVLMMILVFPMFFTTITHTLNAALQGIGKFLIPTLIVGLGVIIKFTLNYLLIPIPELNIYGAAISSLLTQLIMFSITLHFVKKYLNINIRKHQDILKPLVVSIIMGIVAFFVQKYLANVIGDKKATLMSILVALFTYIYLIFRLKVIREEELKNIPMGDSLINAFKKVKLL